MLMLQFSVMWVNVIICFWRVRCCFDVAPQLDDLGSVFLFCYVCMSVRLRVCVCVCVCVCLDDSQ